MNDHRHGQPHQPFPALGEHGPKTRTNQAGSRLLAGADVNGRAAEELFEEFTSGELETLEELLTKFVAPIERDE